MDSPLSPTVTPLSTAEQITHDPACLEQGVGVIYAALDEAVSFVSLTSPVSLSERLSARVAP